MKNLNCSAVVKKRKGGGTLIQSPAVFSDDSEYIYVNSGWGVRVFSIKTGECVKVLETVGSGYGRVLSLFSISNRPVVCTIDTSHQVYLLYWEPKTAEINKKVELKLPPPHDESIGVNAYMVPSVSDRTVQDLCLVVKKHLRDAFSVLFYDCYSAQLLEHPLNGTSVDYSVGNHLLAFGGPPEMRIMATVVRNVGLFIYSMDGKKKLRKWKAMGNGVEWVSVCCHPMEPSVAVGDSLGRCVLFRNPLLNPEVRTIFHWHSLPCSVIAFTPAGSTMYTGGGEHVLVKWNIENPNVKNFLPRLTGPIVHISVSPDNSLVAVSSLDNGVVVVESSHRVKRVLQQLTWGVFSHSDIALFPAGLNFDIRSRSVVLNSRPGHLQFFCPETEILTSVDVCQQNYLTQERNKVIINTDVTRVALSSDSAWMATIETRREYDISLELRLKLWQYKVSSKNWSLNSVVEMPHSGPVGCLKFRPIPTSLNSSADYLLVSTGEDNKFRLWSPSPIDSVYKKGVVWKCEGAGSYKEKFVGPACFSQDGSLLAVAFEHILTLWSANGLKLKTSLSRFQPHIKQVEFGRDRCSHLLLATSDVEMSVWDLLTLSVHWTVQVNPSFLISDPASCYMAVISTNRNLYVFDPMYSEAVHMEGKLCIPNAQIVGATFAPRETVNLKAHPWLRKSILYYINSNQELKSVESECDNETGTLYLVEDQEKSTLFGDLKKVQATSKVKKKEEYVHPRRHQYGQVGTSAISELLRAPCHTMPSISTLCSSLLEALALSKKSVKEKKQEDKMEVDEDVDDEGIGEDSDSDVEISSSSKANIVNMDFFSTTTKLTAAVSKPKQDDVFFIDVDDEVDNIINN